MDMWSMMNDAFSDPMGIITLKKKMERDMILQVYAPMQMRKRERIVNQKKKDIQTSADETQQAIKLISEQLDDSIKGKWSTAIDKEITKQSSKYKEL